jgi:hypothetical protein
MVVDVDKVVPLKPTQPSTGYAVALENNCRLGLRSMSDLMEHGVGIRQWSINAGNAVAENHVRLFAHTAQNLAAGECRSDGIAIGPRVRGKDKLLPSPYLMQDFFQHSLGSGSTLAFAFLDALQ